MDELNRPADSWARNEVVGGLEIFTDEPVFADELQRSGWRWSKSTQSWYHRDTFENVQFANQFCQKIRREKPR
jgi:hypothetical protein